MGKTVLEAKVIDIEKRKYPSKHYVYVIEVTWSEGTQTVIYRRYSNFFEFQCGLLAKFPIQAGEKNPADRCIPFLPGKKIFGRSHVRSVAEKRMGPISDYCKAVIRLPSELSQDTYILNFFEVTPEDINPPAKEEKVKKVDTANEISDPILLEQYTAIADYKKQKNTECSLTAGQVVEVIDKNDNGWWFVHMDDLNEGWVPATYLEPIYGQNEVNKPIVLDTTETHITTSNYTAKNPDELSFERGVLMEVYEKGMDGWWKAKYLEGQGYVPACYLTRYYGNLSSNGPSSGPTEVVSTAHEAIQSTLKPATPASGGGGKKFWPLKTSGVDPYADEPIYAPTPRKETVQKSAKPRPVINIPIVKPTVKTKSIITNNQSSFDDNNEIYSEIKDNESDDEEDAFHDYETMSEHYMTIADFTAGVDDGLSFSSGKQVAVITKNPSGWWFVEMDSKEGWVPSSYLEKSIQPSQSFKPPSGGGVKSKSPPPPVKTRQSISPPVPKLQSSSSSFSSSNNNNNKPITSIKPKPAVTNKRSVPNPPIIKTDDSREGEVRSSVAAMASLLSKSTTNHDRPTPSTTTTTTTKPMVPRRVPTKSNDTDKLTVKHDSVKRSSSSDSIRDKYNSGSATSKSPPSLKPRPNEFVPPPVTRNLSKSTENTPKMGVKFLRKSTENLADIDSSPSLAPRASTISTKPNKPRPPSRTPAVNSFSSQTLRLNELEQSLKKKPLPSKRTSGVVSPTSAVKKSPKRPHAGPNAVKKTPPPRPSNSPAQTRRPSTSPAQKQRMSTTSLAQTSRESAIYVTIADFVGVDSSSLSFKEGESVDVIEKNDQGWWFVSIKDREGWVPSTFIEKTTNKPDRPKPPKPGKTPKPTPSRPAVNITPDTYIATSDYDIPAYEDSGLSLITGQYYEVLERTDTGWWYVQHGSQEGWAPSSFLEPAN